MIQFNLCSLFLGSYYTAIGSLFDVLFRRKASADFGAAEFPNAGRVKGSVGLTTVNSLPEPVRLD